MKKLYQNWWIHNILAHPLMQIVESFSADYASRIHDATLPEGVMDDDSQ